MFIFSGIQPSGNLHIGNYIGAVAQWLELQKKVRSSNKDELLFCIVDLHAITVPQDPKVLKRRSFETAVFYLAAGLDPRVSKIFIQSENPDHTYLAWIFDCVTPFSWLRKMTQFKDKSERQKEKTSVGLFNYPALMAADILLYDTDLVPVGDDQKQHVELTRNIAERFNKRFGNIFRLPRALIKKERARIMSLQDPLHKMSKSDPRDDSRINLLDRKDIIKKKIMKAVTDSGNEIVYDSKRKPAISNLLNIYSSLSGETIGDLEKRYKGKGYGEFKKDLAEVIIEKIVPLQSRYKELLKEEKYVRKVLDEGREFAVSKSSTKIREVREAMGLIRS